MSEAMKSRSQHAVWIRTCVAYRKVMVFGASITLTFLSFFLCSVLLFGLLELFPALARPLHLTDIHYYAITERYLPDEDLVFRTRPFYSISITGYKGDLYSPSYGIDVPSIAYEASFDQYGFRTGEATGQSDVVVLGDSFIEIGERDADTFAKRLERLSGLKTANLGSSWYGPFQFLELLKRYGTQRKPRYAVFSFFEGNDLSDIREYMQWSKGGDYYHFNLTAKSFLQRYEIALKEAGQYIGESFASMVLSLVGRTDQDTGRTRHDVVDLRLGDRNIKVRLGQKINVAETAAIVRSDEWQQLRKIVTEFKTVCLQDSIIPTVMFIPSKAHIYAEHSTEQSGDDWLRVRDEQVAAKANLERAIIQLSEEVNVTFINLSPAFESSAREGNMLYYPFDTHWNSTGREIAARYVARALKELKMN